MSNQKQLQVQTFTFGESADVYRPVNVSRPDPWAHDKRHHRPTTALL